MSDFSQVLNSYFDKLNCKPKDITSISGISPATLSRYRNGSRLPESGSQVIESLAEAFSTLAKNADITLKKEDIITSMNNALPSDITKYPAFTEHYRYLVDSLLISQKDLAHFLDFDSSYLSRIKSGKRIPAKPREFIEKLSDFILNNINDEMADSLYKLLGIEKNDINKTHLSNSITEWFMSGTIDNIVIEKPVKKKGQKASKEHKASIEKQHPKTKKLKHPDSGLMELFTYIDNFNLGSFQRSKRFNELRIPLTSFSLTSSHLYEGEKIGQGILDFYKHTALSKSTLPIFQYESLPLERFGDSEYDRKRLFLSFSCIKRGYDLHMIHRIDDKPETVIDTIKNNLSLYLTGKVTPYYITPNGSSHFLPTVLVSGSAALFGESFTTDFESANAYLKATNVTEQFDGRLTLSTKATDVNYYKKISSILLSDALPFVEVYRGENNPRFASFLNRNLGPDERKKIKSLDIPGLNGLNIEVMPGKFIIITKEKLPHSKMVIHHPSIVNLL